MSLIRAFAREVRWLQQTEDPWRIPSPAEAGGYVFSGRPVNERSALQQMTVWSCVSLIADTMSMLPVDALQRVGKERLEVNPYPQFFVEPHPEMDWPDWFGRMNVSLEMRGNAYGRIISSDPRGYPTAVLPLHPDDVGPKRNRSTGIVEYSVRGEKMPLLHYPAGDMLHIRGMTLPGMITGLSRIEYAAQAIGLALATEEFGSRFFGEGTNPSSVLETEQKMQEETGKAVLAKWKKSHGKRSREPALLTGGLKWKPISIQPNEAQFLETRQFQVSDIARFWRVPPHMVGDVERSTSWGSGIEEQGLVYLTYTMGIRLVRWESFFTRILPGPQYAKFNVAALLRGRLMEQFQSFLLARQGGWYNVDDIRELIDKPPLPDGKGKEYSQPLNWGPLGFDPMAPKPKPTPPLE